MQICLSMQRTPVRSLFQKDPTCLRRTKPMCHNHWTRVLQLSAATTEPTRLDTHSLHNKGSHYFVNKFICTLFYVCVSHSVVSESLRPHGWQPARLLCPWDFPGKNTGVGSHFLLQGKFLTQGLKPGLLNCRQILYHMSHQGSPLFFLQIPHISRNRVTDMKNKLRVCCWWWSVTKQYPTL